MSDEGFIARWSRRKREAKQESEPAPAAPSAPDATGSDPNPPVSPAPPDLPPVESLTPASDFAPFMQPGVDPLLKGRALKALFSDPSLYPMDGLDVYIDDYTRSDPLPEAWLERMNPLSAFGDSGSGAVSSAEVPAAPPTLPRPAEEGAPEAPAADTPGEQIPSRESNNRGAI